MYNKIISDNEYKIKIKNFIETKYDFCIHVIIPADRGAYGETWYVEAQDKKYFVKIHFLTSILDDYKNSLTILEHLRTHGMDFIHNVILAKDGQLWCEYKGGVLAVFSYVRGERCDRTVLPCENIYKLLGKLYCVPTDNTLLAIDDFPVICAKNTLQKVKDYPSFQSYMPTLNAYYDMLCDASELCKALDEKKVITHGDIGNNLIVSNGHIYVVDWDTSKVAYPERDIWFMVKSCGDLTKAKDELRKNGMDSPISTKRLLYYGLYGFFSHFWNHIVAIEETVDERKRRLLSNYLRRYFFNAFINEQIEFLSKIKE